MIINPLGFVVHSFGNVAPWISFQTGKTSLAFSDLLEPGIRADAISCYMQAKLSGRSMRSIPYIPPSEQQPRLLTIRGSRYVREDGESIVIIQFNLQSQTTVEESNIPWGIFLNRFLITCAICKRIEPYARKSPCDDRGTGVQQRRIAVDQ